MSSIGEELPKLMQRIRDEVIPAYESVGPAGVLALGIIRAQLDAATRALSSGDVLAILNRRRAIGRSISGTRRESRNE